MSSDTPPDGLPDGGREALQDVENLLAEVTENCANGQASQSSAEQQMVDFILMFLENHSTSLRLAEQNFRPASSKDTEEKQVVFGTEPKMIIGVQSDADADVVGIILQFLEKHPVCQKIVEHGLASMIFKKHTGTVRNMNKLIDDENVRQSSNPQLIKDFDETRTELDKVISENNQLYTLLGHAIGQPGFFDDKHSLLIAECRWPFTKDDVQKAAQEWLECNGWICHRNVSWFPEVKAIHMWLLSVSNSPRLVYSGLTEWMQSAAYWLEDAGCLKFLITVLWNLLLIPKLSKDQTWIATRLLEFFVILDKDGILDTNQLSDFHGKIIKQSHDEIHLIPRVILEWIKHKLDKTPVTRGECLSLFFQDDEKFHFGGGVYGAPVRAFDEPFVAIMGAVDKLYRCHLWDVQVNFDDNFDILIRCWDYHHDYWVNAANPERYSFTEWAFERLRLNL